MHAKLQKVTSCSCVASISARGRRERWEERRLSWEESGGGGGVKLQNARPLLCISLNNKSAYCVIPCSLKRSDKCKWCDWVSRAGREGNACLLTPPPSHFQCFCSRSNFRTIYKSIGNACYAATLTSRKSTNVRTFHHPQGSYLIVQ